MVDGGGHRGWRRTWKIEDMENGGGHGGLSRTWWLEEDMVAGEGHGG